MKKFFSALLILTLVFSCWTFASADSDTISGAPLNDDIEDVYKQHFDAMVSTYAGELSAAETLASSSVFDAIGMIHFDSEDSLAARQRIYDIASAEDLHTILTGYFDPNDATYSSDATLDARIQAIFSVCGLNLDDYYMTVVRNVGGMPEPITGNNWYCTFVPKASAAAEEGEEDSAQQFIIILYGEDMTVGAFALNAEF